MPRMRRPPKEKQPLSGSCELGPPPPHTSFGLRGHVIVSKTLSTGLKPCQFYRSAHTQHGAPHHGEKTCQWQSQSCSKSLLSMAKQTCEGGCHHEQLPSNLDPTACRVLHWIRVCTNCRMNPTWQCSAGSGGPCPQRH